ncbi:DUF6046 domain-containing protein [Flavobacterium sp. N1994]|uniref:DUF6046 domain-containing protein n=1 Tax=Flavobacterium sp. N1994 TaxID=2986827 RepID=UPI0022235625|nr:DUF6046 domain-containing protein [Flavobacterium sp. N1994]
MLQFDFKKAIARIAFDYVGAPFPDWWLKNQRKYNLPDLQSINAAQLLGEKYFMNIKLRYNGKTFTFPNEPLVSLSLVKTIVETPTVGEKRKGSVLEYITTENYQISIKGVCFDIENPELYPGAQVGILNEMFDIDDALEIVDNPFFELYGIRKIVLRAKNIDEMQGQQGLQAYSFTATSDQDFYADLNELEITQSNFLNN